MPSIKFAVALAALCATAACLGQPADAKKLKDALTGDARASAAANPQCRLFVPAEMKTWLGIAVGPGENAAGGAGCQWHDADYSASAIVTVVPARYHAPPALAKGFKRLPAIGPKAWVAPDMGWTAGTVDGDHAVVVNLDGKMAGEASVVAFLQETLKRRSR
jgi:hypothetical protein